MNMSLCQWSVESLEDTKMLQQVYKKECTMADLLCANIILRELSSGL
jgi:hypothetical protein